MIPNRLKFYFGGGVIDVINRRLADDPHLRLVSRLGDDVGTILDLLAGTGFLARLAVEADPTRRIVALDSSPEMIAVGIRKARCLPPGAIRFVVADATRLPFDAGSFGVVMIAFGLHELRRLARQECLSEVRRVLKPGGRLLIVDVDNPYRWQTIFQLYLRLSHHGESREVTGLGLASMLDRAGFADVHRESGLGRLLPFQLLDARAPAVRSASS